MEYEPGVIKSWNDDYVFVSFFDSAGRGIACRVSDLIEKDLCDLFNLFQGTFFSKRDNGTLIYKISENWA